MGLFDNYNYEINKGLPEYWKQDVFLKPIERFSAILMRDTVQRFMEKLGVLQPFMVWKTLPEEYNWEYGFEDYDLRLASYEENPNCDQTLHLYPNNHIVAQLPLTKRNVHAYIVIDLSSMSFSDTTEFTKISELVIKNAHQELKIKDIDSKTTIEINTKDKTILLNDIEPKAHQIEGSLDILKRTPRDNIEDIDDPLDINEVCEIDIYLPNGETSYCDLYIELMNPVYVTEQNIRIHTLSAFPIEHVRLYGYMCHPFNNKHQWVYLWEKTYAYNDRIIYDKIAKQYDCEIFYIEVKLYGLPAPMYIGFPASRAESLEGIFSLNTALDYWGDIFHMPRREYKTEILEEEERYCFPKYYAYSIEQDYPYEQRIINEYKYNDDWQDYINITDTEGNDIALVRCKDPYIENLYMFTETILPTDILNSKTTMYPSCVIQEDINNNSLKQGVWENPLNLRYDSKSYSIVSLDTQNEEHITNKSYQSSLLTLCYDLSSLPENCKIRGMELKFKGVSNTHADNIYIDERSFLRYTKKVINNETGNHTWQNVNVPLSSYFTTWTPDNSSYILGDPETIFGLDEIIDRDSIEKGCLEDGLYHSNQIRFDIGFANNSDYLDLIIKLFNIQLIVYFDMIKEDVDLQINIPNKIITYNDQFSTTIDANLSFTNKGEIKEIDYNSFVILPPELCFADDKLTTEKKTIKEFNLGNLTRFDYITDNQEFNILHIDEKWDTSIQIQANKVKENEENADISPIFYVNAELNDNTDNFLYNTSTTIEERLLDKIIVTNTDVVDGRVYSTNLSGTGNNTNDWTAPFKVTGKIINGDKSVRLQLFEDNTNYVSKTFEQLGIENGGTFGIIYDGETVKYYANGVLKYNIDKTFENPVQIRFSLPKSTSFAYKEFCIIPYINEEGYVFKSGRYDIVFICGEKIMIEEVYVYDENSINQ